MRRESSSEREILARVAFGRTATADDQLRAVEAARRLHELDLREAAERAALARATIDEADARERRAHRIRSRVTRVAGVAIALGVVAAVAVTWLAPPASRDDAPFVDTMELGHREVAPLPTRVPAAAITTGSAASAERWFDAAQTDEDMAIVLAPDLDPSSTRAVGSSVEGWKVWVAKNLQGDLCVLAFEDASGVGGSSCATPDDFTASGLEMTTIGATALTVFWDGFDLETRPGDEP